MSYRSCADSVNLPGAASEGAASANVGEELSAEQNLTVENIPSLLGVLLGLRNLMPLTCDIPPTTLSDTATQHKGSFGAKVAETDTHVDIVLVLRVNCFDSIH